MATMSLTRYNAARPLAKRQASDDEHRRMASSKAKQQRRDSIYHSQEFVREFVKVGWGDHLDSIVLTCTLTLDEMLQIGHLDRSEGTRACLRLVRVPVINDEISSALYIILTEIARPHIPVSINNSPEDILREIREQMKDEIKMLKDYKKQQKLQEKQEKKQSSTTLPQPVCVFCHDHSEEICHIPLPIPSTPNSNSGLPPIGGCSSKTTGRAGCLVAVTAHALSPPPP
ncbi:hypothetical protein B0T17DRAFT_178879 [Bombardia bombarda]|uniref:Uncharacterized protein n=1 Tax=Bombardia bombarda TaxID=252184 RepID=A0AA39X8A0_9PEZI|nr:hypothetical protein B0T17DRAFT_178879 [Bombardia bombarda]